MKFRATLFLLFIFCSPLMMAQVANQPGDIQVCDNNADGSDINGIVQNINLESQTSTILGSQNPADFTVTYHTSQAEAESGTNAIASSSSYTNITPNAQTIFARVEDNSNGNFDTTSFDIIVNPLPTANSSVDLQQCDDDTDGFAAFNLREAEALLSNNFMNETFEFFNTQADANSGINAIQNTTAYTNQTPINDMVWVRIASANGCHRISQVNLMVSTNSAQVTTFPPRTYSSCDDFLDTDGNDTANNDDTDGISSFDFSDFTVDIVNVFPTGEQPFLSVAYYRSEADAIGELNPIADPSNYRNIGYPNSQQIYVRVDNSQNNNCIGFSQLITLEVDPVPNAGGVSDLFVCDDNGDGFFHLFNLESQTPLILAGQDPSQFTVTYHETQANAMSGALPFQTTTSFTNSVQFSQEIFVRVENAATGCFNASTSFNVIVSVIGTTPEDLEVCDENLDGFAVFDLDSMDAEIANGQTDLDITYHESLADAESGTNALVSPYTNIVTDMQTIYVRIFDLVNGCINTNIDFTIVAKDCTDGDGDSVPDVDEDLNSNGNLNDDDTDGDMIPNYQDDDDDGDGVLTINEDYNNNGDVTDDDINNNGIPDYLDNQATLSTPGIESLQFSVYPNPAEDLITLSFTDNTLTKVNLIMYDLRGRMISRNTLNVDNSRTTMDVSDVSKGIYFVKINGNNQSGVTRLIIGNQ